MCIIDNCLLKLLTANDRNFDPTVKSERWYENRRKGPFPRALALPLFHLASPSQANGSNPSKSQQGVQQIE